jgi:hypothetical protein
MRKSGAHGPMVLSFHQSYRPLSPKSDLQLSHRSPINMPTNHLSRAVALPYPMRAFNHPRIQRGLRQAPSLIRTYASQPADTSELRPLVLEKPDKFRPPSHPSRKPPPRRSFGPRLTNEELEAQKRKQYPHMMPPEDSFNYKILASRGLHLWLSLVRTPSYHSF